MSVPLALTVRQGGATAKSSAALCLYRDAQRGENSPKPKPILPSDTDDWMRGQVDVHELYVYSGSSWKKQSGQYYLGTDNTTYWQLTTDSSGNETAVKSSYTKNNCRTGSSPIGKRQMLVYVQDSGTEPIKVGYGVEKNYGGTITSSCWTSLKPIKS
ncbi:MAG: hypothetical protein K2Y35_18580 [Burkholderiales bacterium]|nr:hypothetical protein [Burkholderiales bacterium]